MKKKTIGITLVLLVIILLGYFAFYQPKKTQEQQLRVQTKKVTSEKIVEVLSTTGTLIPNDEQSLFGQELVKHVNVTVGDNVKKDQVLAEYVNGLQLKASIDGTVTEVNIKNDEMDMNVQKSIPSIKVDDLSSLKIAVGLSKSEATDVRVDQTVTIHSGKEEFQGKVASKDPIATTTQTPTGGATALQAEITFNEKPKDLFVGFDVDVDIVTASEEHALSMPIEALKYDKNNHPFVFIVENGKANKKNVTIGIQSDTNVQIISGLKEKDQVILSPDSTIKENVKVTTGGKE